MQWSMDILQPGRMPGVAGLDAYPVARHCVRMTGAKAQAAAKELAGGCKHWKGPMAKAHESPPGGRRTTVEQCLPKWHTGRYPW